MKLIAEKKCIHSNSDAFHLLHEPLWHSADTIRVACFTEGLIPRTTSSRYSNMEGTITDMQTAAAMAEAARAAAADGPTPATRASATSSGVRGSVQSIDTEDGF